MATNEERRDDALYSYDNFSSNAVSKTESSFLWWCAGAHQRLLKQFPSEQIRYAGLGGVLIATFALATLSSAYAVYTVFGQAGWAILFGLIWGFIIFNFDRFLVSTMRKYGVSKRKQLWMAIPRLALALLIGLTIARPLELKIFEKEIQVKMQENVHHKILKNDSLLQKETALQLQQATTERERLVQRRASIEDTLARLQSAYVQEADGTGGSGRRGVEQLTRLKQEAYQRASVQYTPELAQLAAGMRVQDSLLQDARSGMESRRRQYETSALANLGFLERNKALSDLSEEESSVWWANLLISLLIILIEIGPVLSKLIMPLGPYDIALAREELLQMAADENEIRKGKEMDFERRKNFYQKQKQMSDELVDKLTDIQKKQIDQELEKWERGEWSAKDHRPSMDEVMRRIKSQYSLNEDGII